ncbi:hypothetical protein BJ878DRAFT_532 [Calycina marina]|uniref:Uncharacterized protein n=1 Tax=Calycina marina TaxID=1763456 RepID=A0A9P7ZD43_9HELO|nr:hypothetical protein BJ878DRAFT_532 [Calycina marina]
MLKLARGSISNNSAIASPHRATTQIPLGGSWPAMERSQTPQSPSARKMPGLQILGNIGIIELLEQDERPTFIIDIANAANFTPGAPLQIIFTNASLRASETVLDMITGRMDLGALNIAVTNDFPEFKAWTLSFVNKNESMDVSLPYFVFGGVTWTCSTLRKRLRIISGSGSGITSKGSLPTGVLSGFSIMSDHRRGRQALTKSPLAMKATKEEPSDCLGDIAAAKAPESESEASSHASTDVVPTAQSSPRQAMVASHSPHITSEPMTIRYPKAPSFDWTRLPITAALSRHCQFARSIDWASTPLGPIENWGFDLRAMCNLIMGSPHPAAMYWGDEFTVIYNEAYILLAGQKHPSLMGRSYKAAWAEIWEDIKDIFRSAKDSGQATMKDDDCLFVKRNGFLEESYFSWSIIPLIGEDGSVVGLYNPAFEKTRRKIAGRRMLTLRDVGERTATAKEVKGFWKQVIHGLEHNEYDIPFALLYSVGENSDSELSSMHSGSLSTAPRCTLEGMLGVPKDHRAAVSPLDLKNSDDGFAPYLRESMKTGRPIVLTIEDGTLSFDLIEGMQWRGFGDPCRAVVVCPIHPTTGDYILGFLVLGINPRRPYDDDYSLFIQLLSRQLATSMASAMLFEEEIRRGQRAAQLAALDRQQLSEQLHLRTQEAVESETKFTRMAEFAPVGMFIANSLGEVSYFNDTWWEISRHPRSENSTDTWMESVKEEDREELQRVWKSLVNDRKAVTHEFRFKTPWQDPNGGRHNTWVLMSAFPETDKNGKLKGIFGSMTNISQQKWSEDFQKRRMEEAIELKRQQENFIDMTSHEMRNPLSAILQCADEINSSLSDYRSSNNDETEKLADILKGSIDAAQTIALCAQHQKCIVDDILTLSKLDSALLVVTPVAVQPVAVVQRALKMFAGELESSDIAMEFRMERSYLDLSIGWVKLDPCRLLQVLVNLITNAIKFTNGQDKRRIVVSVGASIERPDENDSDVTYFPARSKSLDWTTDEEEWGTGENLFLKFMVQDTGRGLDESEKLLLCQRFRQASPRTHVQYGGSGLGLFISRELTELQGGEIGVASERGIGSTFAFYVRSRRAQCMPQDAPVSSSNNSLRRTSLANNSGSVTLESKNSSGKADFRSNTTGKSLRTSNFMPSMTNISSIAALDYSRVAVLIVEDNLVNQKVLQKQLKNVGFPTQVANHGGEALDILKKSKFWAGNEANGEAISVVLMDLEMPVMDGLTCAKTIRELEASGIIVKHVPIIAVTANARLEQIESAIATGIDDVVSKPFRIPELIPKIEELISRSQSNMPSKSAENTQPIST